MGSKVSSSLLSAVILLLVGSLGVAPGVATDNMWVSFFCYLGLIISLQASLAAIKLRYGTFVFLAIWAVGMVGVATYVSKLAGQWLWMPPWLWIGFMLLAGGLYICLKGKRWIGIISLGGATVCVFFSVLGPMFLYETPHIASWHWNVILKTALLHMLIVPGGFLFFLLTLLLCVKGFNRWLGGGARMCNAKWSIDPDHPFDSIGFIKEERRRLFRKKNTTLILHQTWMEYVKNHVKDPNELKEIIQQVAAQQNERYVMKTKQNSPFYGDEAGFEHYCRMKYKRLYEHIIQYINNFGSK